MIEQKKLQSDLDSFRHHDKDTGSAEVQVIQLTYAIERLRVHLIKQAKDYSSKRGMIKLVAQRKKALQYLRKHTASKYKEIIERLGIRK